MILSGREIVRHMGEEIIIRPFDMSKVNPNSYNLTLADELMVYENHELDMKKRNEGRLLHIPEEGIVLQPNKLYLGRTREYTRTKCFVPMLEGRSSIGRLGLFIHVTAGFGDVGFPATGRWKCSAYSPSAFTQAWKSARFISIRFSVKRTVIMEASIRTIRGFSPASFTKISKSSIIMISL